jgi:hypothetical protein
MPVRSLNPLHLFVGIVVLVSVTSGAAVISPLAAEEPALSRDQRWIWEQVTDAAAWPPCDGAGVLVFEDRMWLLGGWNPTIYPMKCHNEVWNSRDGVLWNLVKPNTFLDTTFDTTQDWEGRHTAGYAVFNHKMWIVGGDPLQGHYQFDVWNSADGEMWANVNQGHPVPWGPRALHYTLVFQEKIWVIGGQTTPQFAPAKEVLYRDLWNTTDGIHWKQVEPVEPFWPARGMIGGSVVFNDRIWILGGGVYDTPAHPSRRYYNDVWSSPDGVHWEQHIEQAPWAARQYHDVAVFDGQMWVLEGFDGTGNRRDVWHSADGITWQELPGTPWAPRHAASVFVFNNALWMVAGNNFEKDVWKLIVSPVESTDVR